MPTPKLTLRALAPWLCALSLLLTPFLAHTARAATRTVTNTGDNGGSGQLRIVVALAQNGDTITFAPGLGTITLTGGQIPITRPLAIVGPATVSGNHNSRVFEVKGGTASAPVTLSGLTIENGTSGGGGGVLVDGGDNVTLTNCTLTGDTATNSGYGGGLSNGGTAMLTGCTLTGDTATAGGGLYSSGTLTLTGCTLTGNTATGLYSYGGGLVNDGGTATLTGCTLSNDSATYGGGFYDSGGTATLMGCALTQNSATFGGGFLNDNGTVALMNCALSSDTASGNAGLGGGLGGGLYNDGGTATLTGCTLLGDTAINGGGLDNNKGTATLTNCTLTRNRATTSGGGLFNNGGATATLTDDILYGDAASQAGPEVFNSGTATVSYCDIQGGPAGTGDLDADPQFITSYNSNTGTSDLHLRAGSPCAGAGTTSAPAYRPSDIDGRPRPTPGYSNPSLGAYEAAPSGAYSPVVGNIGDGVPLSLRAAVQCANDYPGGAVTFDPQVFSTPQTIMLTGGQLTLSAPMTIAGPVGGVAVSANNAGRVFEVSNYTGGVALLGLTIENGDGGSSGGGGVLVDQGASVTLTACALVGNSASGGGGLFAVGTARLTGCTLTGNSAPGGQGGGLYSYGGTLTLTDDILYGDTGGEVSQSGGGTVTASYSDIQGGFPGPGDLDADPQFVTPYTTASAPFDLHPRFGSPVIGAGVYQSDNTTDITGATRANPPAIGAYEGQAAQTAITLASSLNPSNFGQSVTFTVTVQNTSGGSAVPTGTVTLHGLPGGDQTLTLSGGQATYQTNALPSGTYSLTATYTPTGSGFAASATASALTQTVLVNNQTTLTSSLNPSNFGQSVTFTATVDTQGGPAPMGQVAFSVDGSTTPAATVTLSGTTASYATASLPSGKHTVTATFTGTGFAASSGSLTQTVLVNNQTTLASSLNPSNFGQSVTFTATVDTEGGPPPMGLVFFYVDGSTTPASAVMLSPGATTATFTTSGLSVGRHMVMATFTGTGFAASSGSLTQTVNPATVTAVSAQWGARTAALGVGASLLPPGRGTDVPWLGVKSFTLTLSAPEALAARDVSVTGQAHGAYAFTLAGSGGTYMVTLSQPVTVGDRVTVSLGNTNVVSFSGALAVLPGDISDDGAVNASDLALARNAVGTGSVFADIDGDGAVTTADYGLVRQRAGARLP